MTDTHTHIYLFESKPEEPDAAVQAADRATGAGVRRMIFPAVDRESVYPLLELHAQRPGNTYTAMGLHPTEVGADWKDELEFIVSMLSPTHPVAIGEVGIDLYWDQSNLELQKEAFSHQLLLAEKLNLPVIIHCRDGLDVCLECIEKTLGKNTGTPLVFHSFTGSPDDVRKIREVCDPYFGINGVVTFKNAKELPDAVREIGIDRLLLETDSPYLAPVPKRGRRNESSYLIHIRDKIAEILGLTPEEVEEATDRNAEEFFNLPTKI